MAGAALSQGEVRDALHFRKVRKSVGGKRSPLGALVGRYVERYTDLDGWMDR